MIAAKIKNSNRGAVKIVIRLPSVLKNVFLLDWATSAIIMNIIKPIAAKAATYSGGIVIETTVETM